MGYLTTTSSGDDDGSSSVITERGEPGSARGSTRGLIDREDTADWSDLTGSDQPEMPGSTDYGDETFQDTVQTSEGYSPGGIGVSAPGRGGYENSVLGGPVDFTADVAGDVASTVGNTAGDVVDSATPGWFDWVTQNQEKVAIGVVVFGFLFVLRPYASAGASAADAAT